MKIEYSTLLKQSVKNGDVMCLSQYLKDPVSSKVEQSLVKIAVDNKQMSVLEYFRTRVNSCIGLMDFALECAVANADLNLVKNIMMYADPTHNKNHILEIAVKNIDPPMVAFLLQYCDPTATQNNILALAVRKGDATVLQTLMSRCDPKSNCSAALQETVAYQNQEMFDLLYPVSNPQEAWDVIKNDAWFDRSQRKMLKSRLDIDKQHAKITRAVEKSGSIKVKSKI